MKKGKINILVWRQEADENTRDIWVIVLYYHVDAFKKGLYYNVTTLVDIFILYQMNKFKSKTNCNEVQVTSY